MRGKRAIVNSIMSLLQELVSIVCAFILPRLILSTFGSKYNGLTTSVTQFLSCAVLLRAGIGGATKAALYKPIALGDVDEINGIVKATDLFMKKVGLILVGLILIFSATYPILVRNEFDWLFTFSLFLIIGASTFAESFFGITYEIVLHAFQNYWFPSLLKSVCTVLNTGVATVLILCGCSIHVVKLGSALIFVIYPIIQGIYVKKKYHINTDVIPNTKAIKQRWDAFWHQVADFVMNNTDVMVLTVFTDMLEVSVYSVYNLIANGLKRSVLAFSRGLESAFGDMIAKDEKELLATNVKIAESIVYSVSTILYSCAAVLILDFVAVYTKKIDDVEYVRPLFAYLLVTAGFFYGIRLPYQLVVQAAGHYRQTKCGAIIEPIINISVSVVLVFEFGIVGVAVGTLVATVFRTVQYSLYMCRNIVVRSGWISFSRILVALCEGLFVFICSKCVDFSFEVSYVGWITKAVLTCAFCTTVVLAGNFLFFRQDMINTWQKLRHLNRSHRN